MAHIQKYKSVHHSAIMRFRDIESLHFYPFARSAEYQFVREMFFDYIDLSQKLMSESRERELQMKFAAKAACLDQWRIKTLKKGKDGGLIAGHEFLMLRMYNLFNQVTGGKWKERLNEHGRFKRVLNV